MKCCLDQSFQLNSLKYYGEDRRSVAQIRKKDSVPFCKKGTLPFFLTVMLVLGVIDVVVADDYLDSERPLSSELSDEVSPLD